MSPAEPNPGPARPTADDINQQLRNLAAGRVVWTPEARMEWQRLTAAWAAVAQETVVPAA